MYLIKRRKSLWTLLLALALVSGCGGEASESSVATTTTLPTTDATDSTEPSEGSTTTEPAAGSTTTTLAALEPPTFDSLDGINIIGDFSGLTSAGLGLWQDSVPSVEDIRIASTADGTDQPALWLAPDGDGVKPLLVVLHSSSAEYLQHAGIPYAMFAAENGWAVVAPQFRGINDDADSTGSELAVQDVVDAIEFATAQEGVDVNRVYAVGYSGGGTMALLLAGRHPDKVTAVAAWGPPYDLIEFYRQSLAEGRHYASDIHAACGGDPTSDSAAEEDCLQRSPLTYLDTALEQQVPVFIAQGIHDQLLSPSHGAGAFNQLADPGDRLSEEELAEFAAGRVPEALSGSVSIETYFGEGDPAPVFARQSGPALLVFFDADHDMVYKPTLHWFASGH